ncbi:periodic tryptophan protein 1 homolog [Ruditapes philippinarum]|uniref:periodic tryptophan protein 1 homolog n=1 Tax=Ruditapes philippinarum TaxID=129788 RepID=UPI00295B1CA4|nr:periodic tryptophan protein 1 homolog [Ruditapes philippinarum]
MSIIPCVTWVKRGCAKAKPEKLQIAKEDLKRIIEETQEKLDDELESGDEELEETEETENTHPAAGDVKQESEKDELDSDVDAEVARAKDLAKSLKGLKKGKKPKVEGAASGGKDDFESRYNLDDYDEEENDWSNPLKGISGLTMYSSNDEDPYITLKNDPESDEEEDFEIKSTDNLMLVARAESDFCSVEVHVYNSELENLYVHHDILLSSFPLALEWIDYDLRDASKGNFVAIATMDPTIDIWDVDLVESLEPLATLGQKVSKKKKKNAQVGHTDAVLDLSWNSIARHILASASADNTVGLWDLTEGRIAMSLKQHKDKVQCVKWHPVEEHMLLSGSFDKCVKMYDCRSPDENHKSWSMKGEIEKLLWNNFSPMNFFASTDTGHVFYMDSRQDKPVYTLSAHTESVTGLCMSSEDPRLLVTTSTDRTIKIWDIEGDKPSLVHSQDIKLGQLHCMGNCPDAPYVFGIGGEKNVKVWDIRDIKDVFSHFWPGASVEKSEDTEDTNETVDDSGVAMETAENEDTMETETVSQLTSAANTKTKKKKKKKKSKKTNNT